MPNTSTSATQPKTWYQQTGIVIAFLIFFFPVGLYLMWKYKVFPTGVCIVVTIIIVGIGVSTFSEKGQNQKSNALSREANTSSTRARPDTYSPVGGWSYNDGVYDITLIIQPGGTFYYRDNDGNSTGNWSVVGSTLYLDDSSERRTCSCSRSTLQLGNFSLSRK